MLSGYFDEILIELLVLIGQLADPGSLVALLYSLSLSLSPYFLEIFDRHVPSQRPSRQCVSNTFIAPSCRTSAYQNSFHPAAIHFWHSLPESVVSAPTIGVLKLRLHDHLFALEDTEL